MLDRKTVKAVYSVCLNNKPKQEWTAIINWRACSCDKWSGALIVYEKQQQHYTHIAASASPKLTETVVSLKHYIINYPAVFHFDCKVTGL